MATLMVREGANRGVVHPLEADEIVLGRDPECTIRILDGEVSRRHARILHTDGTWRIEDLESRNGTRVGGLRCAERTLAHGDEIRLGGTRLLFLESDPAEGGSTLTRTGGSAPEEVIAQRGIPTPPLPETESFLVGESPALYRIEEQIARFAASDVHVLVTGETGTGKEIVARALHANSPRRAEAFVPIHCASFSPQLLESELFGHERGAFTGADARRLGFFELASAGTLFLDEVGEIPPEAQAKLLRVLENREFYRVGGTKRLETSARFLFATHRDLDTLVAEGRFREDLLHRMRVATLHLPPLRERPEDIRPLAEHFLDRYARETGQPKKAFADDAVAKLDRHPWPGNVRELRNWIERTYLAHPGETIRADDLPLAASPTPSAPRTLQWVEREHIAKMLADCGGNKTRAAEALGIDRKTLYAKIERLGIGTP